MKLCYGGKKTCHQKKNKLTEQTNFLEYLFVMLPRKISQYRMYMSGDQRRAVPKPEVLGWGAAGEGGGCKTTYRQWKLHHVTLIKWVRTTASIRTAYCRRLIKCKMFYLQIWDGITGQSFHSFIFILFTKVWIRLEWERDYFFIALNKTARNCLSI